MSTPTTAAPLPPATTTSVRAVLLDADGVLQLIGTPWHQALADAAGEEFCEALLREEVSALEGRESLMDLLTRLVERLRLPTRPKELAALWWQATPDPAARDLVAQLRQAGYLTVLATNQQRERMEWMRTHLRYDGLCDLDAYSCTLGVAKPDPRYFTTVLERAGVDAHEALFVDDDAENIAAAAALGIRTLHHRADAGGAVLRAGVVQALQRAQCATLEE